jgi:hypothetical protein
MDVNGASPSVKTSRLLRSSPIRSGTYRCALSSCHRSLKSGHAGEAGSPVQSVIA